MVGPDEAAASGLNVEWGDQGPPMVLRVHGELDLDTAAGLRGPLHGAIEAGHTELVVDLSGLRFLDSTGISVLVDAVKACARAGGSLTVSEPSPHVRRVLEITGLLELLGVPAEPTAD